MIELVRIEDLSVTPSLNEFLRMHWTKQRKLTKLHVWELKLAGAHDSKYAAGAGERRSVVITSFRKERLDPDNLSGGCKPLVDALVRTKLLIDDDEEHADVTYCQVKTLGDPCTEVRIFILKGGKNEKAL